MPDTPSLIFISHASQDRRIAEALCTEIEKHGLPCWVAWRDIVPGESFQTAIVRAIRRSRIMLLMFTTSAGDSEEVKKELALAGQQGVIVIPLRMEEVEPEGAFAFELATRQWIDMFEDWGRATEKLLARLLALSPEEDARAHGGRDIRMSRPVCNKLGEQAIAELPAVPVAEQEEPPLWPLSSEGMDSPFSTEPAEELPVPNAERPMIVVLPFESIGGDSDQIWFADGLTTDLVTDLSRFQDLHVVSPQRHGFGPVSFARSAPGWQLPDAAAYICSGSVRRGGGRIRINIQLGDARTKVALWAERFDRPLEDLFSVQEALAELLPAHLASRVTRERTLRVRRHPPASLGAYDLCLRGRELHIRATEADTLAARALFDRAIALDPYYATAYAWQAYTVQRGFTHLWGEPRGPAAARLALELARLGVRLEPGSSSCLVRQAFAYLLNGDWEEALESGRAAVIANPSAAETRHCHADILVHAGDPAEAEREMRLALALDPFHPPTWRTVLGRALLLAGRVEEAASELLWCAERLPGYAPCHYGLAVAAAETGRMEAARTAVHSLLRINPALTVHGLGKTLFFRDPAMLERFRAGCRAGGMSER